jgi:hypothetical protein
MGQEMPVTRNQLPLSINNLDEVAPTITSATVADVIDENTGVGQLIYTATADDSLDISAGVSFSLAAGSDSALFIDASNGQVTLATDPDAEIQDQYSFTVVASDGVNPVVEQLVTLDINDLDDAAPTITSGGVATSITENSGAGQVIYQALADDGGDDIAKQPVTFSFAEGSDPALTIDATTGEVTLTDDPNYETQNQYSFTVIATDGAGNASDAQAVTLYINGYDDEAPVFASLTEVTVAENDSKLLYQVDASDADSSAITYTLKEDDLYQVKAGAMKQLIIQNPDETLSMYVGLDDSSASNYSSVGLENIDFEISYNIEEVNYIQWAEYQPAISFGNEISPGLIEVGIVYFPNPANVLLPFGYLDFELLPNVTSTEFEIRGILINDAAPDEVTVDDDSIYRYLGNEGIDINPQTGAVSLVDPADYESQSFYSFTITATDEAGNFTEHAVTVNIDDVNDTDEAAPNITSDATVDAINENLGAGQLIYTVTAVDSSDDIISTPITYALVDDLEGALSIDDANGEVTLVGNPDFETRPEYSFAVLAIDGAGNQSEPLSLTLEINDVDEAVPEITSGSIATPIAENSGADQSVYQAISNVQGPFSLAEDSDPALTIDATSGEVTLTVDPDYETQGTYSFAVIASDEFGNSGEAQAVTLSINNLDEIAPTITSGETATAIDENSGTGQVIYTAQATDSDADVMAAPITYSLAEGSDPALTIDATSGEVTLTVDPDYETQNQYSFAVIATDGATNASDAQSVTLDINNLDDAAPTITSGETATAINENSGAGQVIYTAQATDSDTDVIVPPITYSLAEGSDPALTIGATSGEVTLTDDPDHETQNQYSFAVIATDGATNASDAQSVTLDINNLDDSAPSITSAAEAVVVDIGDVNPIIYTATADDSADFSGGVSFSLNDTTNYPVPAPVAGVSEVSIPELVAATQHVYVSSSDKSADGTQETVVLTYNVDDTTTTGLGLYIHFDSSVLSASDISAITTNDLFVGGEIKDDSDNLDSDSSTDKYINFSWASLFGNWPGSAPADLASITFDIAEGATGSSAINFTASSNAANYTFDGQAHDVAISSEGAPVESQLSIDAVTGEVSLSGELDPAAQSEYSFTLTATDVAGYSDNLDVVIDIDQPAVDAAIVVVLEGDTSSTPIYQASANIENASYTITDLTQYPDTDSGPAESEISIPELVAATQHVYVSSSDKSADGTQETVVLTYNVDDTTTTGLGLYIHFDSSVLSASDISAITTNDLFVGGEIKDDSDNLDSDSSTDKYINFSWASLFGNWPGSAPADLASITFDIAEGATGSSAINFTASSNAANYTFDGQAHDLLLAPEPVVPVAELSIDNSADTVSLELAIDEQLQADYSLSVEATDANGNAIGSQIVPVVVVDQIVNADASSYTGTADEDVFALADGSAEITSDAGEDEFILDPAYASAAHTITDFESGVDTIHIGAALVAAGYTPDNAPTQLLGADMSADILDLVNGDDSSLDNLFGATYDDASNTLTVFADTDSSAGSTDMDSYQITLDDSATVEDEDIVADLNAFIA